MGSNAKGSAKTCNDYIDVSSFLKAKNDRRNSPLHKAVLDEHLSKVKRLTKNIICRNNYGCTPVHFCSFNSGTNVVDYFVTKGVNLNEADSKGNTLLHYAIRQNNETLVNKLLAKKVELNAPNMKGGTPLHIAISIENPTFVRKLLDGGACVDKSDNEGNTPLHVACDTTRSSPKRLLIIELLLHTGLDINKQNKQGNTALHHACRRNDTVPVKMLLEKLADVGISNCIGETPLHISITRRYSHFNVLDIITELLNKGADINHRDKEGNTPLHKASGCGHNRAIEMLLDKGAEIDLQNLKGNTPLHIARTPEIVYTLCYKGADRNIRNHEGNTALHVFVNKESDTKFLVDDVNINNKNNKGNTALHIAAAKEFRSWMFFLIRKGADIDVRNNKNQCPYHVAPEGSYEKDVLLELAISSKVVGLIDDSELDSICEETIESCRKELEKIKEKVVYKNYTLNVVFSERNNPYYLSNKNDSELSSALDEYLSQSLEFEKQFPHYHLILRNIFEKSKRRFKLLTQAFDSLSHSNKNPLLRDLPILVKRMLLSYLDNESLYNLSRSI